MNTFAKHLVPWLFVLAAIAVIVSPFAWSRLVAWRERRRDAQVQQRQRQYKDEGYARELRRGLPVTDATLEATREKLLTFQPDTRPSRRPVPPRPQPQQHVHVHYNADEDNRRRRDDHAGSSAGAYVAFGLGAAAGAGAAAALLADAIDTTPVHDTGGPGADDYGCSSATASRDYDYGDSSGGCGSFDSGSFDSGGSSSNWD
jgi:hypothetical protein